MREGMEMNSYEESLAWTADWAERKLSGREHDIVRRMMKIAKSMDGPYRQKVADHAERAIKLCKEFYETKDKEALSIDIKKEIIMAASYLPCEDMPREDLSDVMKSVAETRDRAMFFGTIDVMTGKWKVMAGVVAGGTVGFAARSASIASMIAMGAIAGITAIISQVAKNKNEKLESQARDALNAVKYCVSVEMMRPVLPDRFDELYAEKFADIQNGKLVIVAPDAFLDCVADVLRENAPEAFAKADGEGKTMSREDLEKVANDFIEGRRKALGYPKISTLSLKKHLKEAAEWQDVGRKAAERPSPEEEEGKENAGERRKEAER